MDFIKMKVNYKTIKIYLTEKEYSDCLNIDTLEDILEQYKMLNDIEIKHFNLTCLDSSDDELTSMFSEKVQKYFKNKTLKVISLSYIISSSLASNIF